MDKRVTDTTINILIQNIDKYLITKLSMESKCNNKDCKCTDCKCTDCKCK